MSQGDNDWFSPHPPPAPAASGAKTAATAKPQPSAPSTPPRPAAPTFNKLPARPASTLPGMTAAESPAPAAPRPPPTRATMPGHAQASVASTQLGHAATIVATAAAPAVVSPTAPAPAPAPPRAAPVAPSAPPSAGATSLATVAATPPRPAGTVPAVDLDLSIGLGRPADKKRRTLAIAAGAAAGIVVALVVGLRGGRHAAPPRPTPAPVAVAAPAPAVAAPPAAEPAPPPAAAEPIAEAERAAPTRGPAHRVASAKTSAKSAAHPKGRRVAGDAAAPRAERRPPVRKLALASAKKEKPAGDREAARAAYERGNNLLFSGDSAGAASAYQEAVRLAPGDPVGYRGLGLASEKEGKTDDAISAFVSYLKLSRHAHDREVIARRLSRLTHARKK